MSRRSLGTWLVLAAVLLCGALVVIGLSDVSEQRTLPLADTSIIRTQAADKRLDPALIAAVIYCESKFEPHSSSAGADVSGDLGIGTSRRGTAVPVRGLSPWGRLPRGTAWRSTGTACAGSSCASWARAGTVITSAAINIADLTSIGGSSRGRTLLLLTT